MAQEKEKQRAQLLGWDFVTFAEVVTSTGGPQGLRAVLSHVELQTALKLLGRLEY